MASSGGACWKRCESDAVDGDVEPSAVARGNLMSESFHLLAVGIISIKHT